MSVKPTFEERLLNIEASVHKASMDMLVYSLQKGNEAETGCRARIQSIDREIERLQAEKDAIVATLLGAGRPVE